MDTTLLAVNGTLMRGLALNPNLLSAGATFAREAHTAPCYRLWSLGDRHPAMVRQTSGGASVALEVDDLDKVNADLKAKGVRYKADMIHSPVCRMSVILDSEGNSIILHELNKKK